MGDAHRMGALTVAHTLQLRDGSAEYTIAVDGDTAAVEGLGAVTARAAADGTVRLAIDGAASGVAWAVTDGDVRWVFVDGEAYRFEVTRAGARRRTGGHHGTLMAPMPATVVRIEVEPGQAVERGDVLVILEAMKMELPVRAPLSGTISAVHCKPGELVQPGVPLVEMEETQK